MWGFRVQAAGNEPDFHTVSDFLKIHLGRLQGLFEQAPRNRNISGDRARNISCHTSKPVGSLKLQQWSLDSGNRFLS